MIAIVALSTLLFVVAPSDHQPPADLLIEWVTESRHPSPPIEGESGTSVDVGYRVRNIGGSDAYAVLIRSHSALGPLGQPIRLHPGPKAGRGIERTLRVPLARGMRELCVEGRLQTLGTDPHEDPSPNNNRACRPIRIVDRHAHQENGLGWTARQSRGVEP